MSTLSLTSAGPSSGAAQIGPISTTPAVWLKADRLTLANNDPVSSWTDLSGSNRHAVQATGSKQPLYKTNIQNSKAVVRFDGSDDCVASTFGVTLTRPNTLFLALSSAASQSGPTFFDGIAAGARHAGLSGGTFFQMFSGTSVVDTSKTRAFSFAVLSLIYNGASTNGWADGAAIATNISTGTHNLTGLTVGSRYSQGASEGASTDVGEVLVYNGALGTTDRQAVEAYLKSEWGTP